MTPAAEKAKAPPADVDRDGPNFTGTALAARLATTWGRPRGLIGWLSSVDHKDIGRRYIVTALVFLALAGALAMVMRLQLSKPENDLVGAARYDEIFTMHGTTMMFLFAVPVMQGMQIYLTPLMIGTRAIAFPRLTALSFWLYLAGGCLLWGAFILNIAPDVGWFAYPPLSGPQYGVGKRVDIWAQMITFTEVASLAAAVTLIATILKQRAPGMTLARMPLYVWTTLVTSFMVIFSMPAVALASSLLLSDRLVGTHFYNPAEGGDALLWQHLFWFFGHPEVYIIFLPATGFVSEIVATFARRSIVFYPIVVLSVVATGILAFGLWVHHMFSTGLPRVGYSFYTAASISVSIPTALQIFCWIATLWEGRPRFEVPLLYVIGFIVTFVIGGLTGVMIAAVPLDLQLHDTYFIVAHFHYVLIGGAVFPLLGAITYWFPKFTGRMMAEGVGKLGFWMLFVGFQLAFFPMHIAGIYGMPRRVYTYPAAAPNPWGAPSLEWATACPPAAYNFAHIPVVDSRAPLWDSPDTLSVVHGLRVDDRELLLTTVINAVSDVREPSAEPTPWPFVAALAISVMFIGSIFSPWALVFGAVPATIALTAWFWPKSPPGVEPTI